MIAQKNLEIDHLEEDISQKEKQLENQRSKARPTLTPQHQSRISNQEHVDASSTSAVQMFLAKYQGIINFMDLGIVIDNSDALDFPRILLLCKSGCDKLIERTMQLISAITTGTDKKRWEMSRETDCSDPSFRDT